MTPDTPEGRERLTRMEERVESNRRQIDAIAPLVRQVERVQWHLDELAEDFKSFRTDMRDQRAEDKKSRAEEMAELRRNVSDQILVVTDGLKGCSNKIGEIAAAQEKQWEAERQRREAERKEREAEAKTAKMEAEQSKTQRFVARYGLVTALAVVLVSSITSIIIAFFGGG